MCVLDDLRTSQPPRARPVADLPGDALLARADELARRWAIALILVRPLERIGELPLEELAREAPSLCAQALRALQSDVELDRLTGRGAPSAREDSAPARRLAEIADARDPAAAVDAVEALRGVLWEALLDQLHHPSARQVGDLSDRLAYVCASVLAATLLAPLPAGPEVSSGSAHVVVASVETDGAAPEGSEHRGEPSVSGPETDLHESRAAPASGRAPVIVDEHQPEPEPVPVRSRAVEPPAEVRPPPARSTDGRPSSWDRSPPLDPARHSAEIAIRDERGEQGPSAWIGSIGRQLERFERDGLAFAVLLIELLDIERVLGDLPADDVPRLAEELEQAIVPLRPPSGSLNRESSSRYWLLAPQTDRAQAARLAERLVHAIDSATAHRANVSLQVAIGAAVCPEDGHEAAALAAQADLELYAARSSARSAVGPSGASRD
jgi:GGDEF domain-containing protein